MRNRPLPRMLDGSVRRQGSTQASHGRQCLHPLPPSAEGRKFRIHAFSFLGQSESIGARQEVEVGKGKLGTQEIIPPVSQLVLERLKTPVDLRTRARHARLAG